MKLRERPSEVQDAGASGAIPTPVDAISPGETLRKASDLANATDDAIRRALSGNSEQFLSSNRQQGGQ
jgi:hypothetical protein